MWCLSVHTHAVVLSGVGEGGEPCKLFDEMFVSPPYSCCHFLIREPCKLCDVVFVSPCSCCYFLIREPCKLCHVVFVSVHAVIFSSGSHASCVMWCLSVRVHAAVIFTGGSHGGEGGNTDNTNTDNAAHGSTTSPTDLGNGPTGSPGGGQVYINIQNALLLDGIIGADGADSDSSSRGGGSGGSVFIQAGTLTGHGIVTTNGGSGGGSGGGGGGGRVAVVVQSFNSFLGSFEAHGGTGRACGGAGTVYIQQSDTGVTRHTVTADNVGQVCEGVFTVIPWPDVSIHLHFDIRGHSMVKFDAVTSASQPLIISNLEGDRTGGILIPDQQVLEIATAYGTQHPFALKCKLELQAGSTATVPSKLLLTDTDSTTNDKTTFNVSGTVLGLTELVVAEGGQAFFSLESQNGVDASRVGQAKSLLLSKLSITHGGRITLGEDGLTEFTLRILQELDVEYGGEVVGRVLSVTAPTASLAFGGLVTTSGLGQPPQTGSTQGGTHGGHGGSTTSPSLPDTVYDVTATGEGGQSSGSDATSLGGAGGGFIQLNIDQGFTLHGTISSNGSNGDNAAGGGAGGSVIITTTHLLGGGQVQVAGGDGGENGGGGGAGGRINVLVNTDSNYTGTFIVRGGSSTVEAGGSGTAYIKEYWTGKETLIISNTGTSGPAFAQTPLLFNSGTITFSHLDLGQNVQLVLPASAVYFIAQEISCGTGTVVVVENGVTFSADVNKNETRLSCSFDISQTAELRLPNVVELLGASNKFDGECVCVCVCVCAGMFQDKDECVCVCVCRHVSGQR